MRRTYTNFVGFGLMLIAINAKAQNTFPATGKVGIGTTNPLAPLEVVGTALVIGPAEIGEQTNGTAVIDAYGGDAYFGNNTATNGIAINPSGFVGIGTVTPGASLHVIAPALAATSGSTLPLLTLQNPNGNQNQLNVTQIRSSNVNNWTSATTRIQQVTDVSQQAYIDFNPVGGTWDMAFGADRGEIMRLLNTGNVGIGTTAPGAKFEVNGNVKLTAGSGASVTFQDGSVQTVAWNGVLSGGDYAESVDVIGDRMQYEPGDVLVIDPASKGKFMKSTEAYSTAVMGIYSTRPGVVGRRQTTDKSHMKEEVPMAMVGVVPTKVSAESGAIKAGDLLVTSSRPGYAMKGKDRSQMMGAIIGKALEPLDAGTGVIEVAVSIQ